MPLLYPPLIGASLQIGVKLCFPAGYTLSMVEIPLTPEQFTSVKKLVAEKQGITLDGDEGQISKSGVKAGYKYAEGLLTVTILEKPFFVTTEYCEEQLKGFLSH
jgi:hypothetical protein